MSPLHSPQDSLVESEPFRLYEFNVFSIHKTAIIKQNQVVAKKREWGLRTLLSECVLKDDIISGLQDDDNYLQALTWAI
ncbi:hypothetical protein STEG23_035325 [Scotinomys teguina]